MTPTTVMSRLLARLKTRDESGMATVEYALVTVAAVIHLGRIC